MEPKKGSFRAWTVWLLSSIFYLYEFFVRVAPGVMEHDLQTAFHATGAVLGAMVLGVTETFAAAFVSSAFRDLFSYALMIIIIIVRPGGLMGTVTGEKA